jgi:hypothetical protein
MFVQTFKRRASSSGHIGLGDASEQSRITLSEGGRPPSTSSSSRTSNVWGKRAADPRRRVSHTQCQCDADRRDGELHASVVVTISPTDDPACGKPQGRRPSPAATASIRAPKRHSDPFTDFFAKLRTAEQLTPLERWYFCLSGGGVTVKGPV